MGLTSPEPCARMNAVRAPSLSEPLLSFHYQLHSLRPDIRPLSYFLLSRLDPCVQMKTKADIFLTLISEFEFLSFKSKFLPRAAY